MRFHALALLTAFLPALGGAAVAQTCGYAGVTVQNSPSGCTVNDSGGLPAVRLRQNPYTTGGVEATPIYRAPLPQYTPAPSPGIYQIR